jgi:uncharacterized protein (TIGR00251 family)
MTAAGELPPWLAGRPGEWSIRIHAMPGAARSGSAGIHDGALKVRIAAPPLEGRANEALRAWIAGRLEVPRSAVEIAQGESGRRKRVRVAAELPQHEVISRLVPAS